MGSSVDGMPGTSIRVAAAGDIHIRDSNSQQVADALRALEGDADLILVAGDVTTHGEPAQAELFAEACRPLSVPVITVLGNHDWHANLANEVRAVLEESGVSVLERDWTVREVHGTEVGIVGLKGFV